MERMYNERQLLSKILPYVGKICYIIYKQKQ